MWNYYKPVVLKAILLFVLSQIILNMLLIPTTKEQYYIKVILLPIISIVIIGIVTMFMMDSRKHEFLKSYYNKWGYMSHTVQEALISIPTLSCTFNTIPTYNDLNKLVSDNIKSKFSGEMKAHLEQLCVLNLIMRLKDSGLVLDEQCNMFFDNHQDEYVFLKIYRS